MNLYISDLHFGHQGIIAFDNRPFADAEEMDRVQMERWNAKVKDEDDVYILGDFACDNEKPADWYLSRLKGRKHLVIGNHDEETLSNEKAIACFESVEKLLQIKDGDKLITLGHFPMVEWDGCFDGAWHIYGHIHGRRDEVYEFMKTRARSLNAGCMVNNFTPASFEELVENNKAFRGE